MELFPIEQPANTRYALFTKFKNLQDCAERWFDVWGDLLDSDYLEEAAEAYSQGEMCRREALLIYRTHLK